MGFKVVHGIIAAGSIAFGLAAARIGYRALRPSGGSPPGPVSVDRGEIADREGLASR